MGEYQARKLLEDMGYRVTWQAEDQKKPDLHVVVPRGGKKEKALSLPIEQDWEVKYRSSVPKCLYDWLEEKDADALLVKRVNPKDNRSYPWLVVRILKK
jgi:hypothetical protein